MGGSSRRLYQRVEGLTIGLEYTFSVDSRSEAMNTPSEVYMLNTEIADETGINTNGGADANVDGFMTITNDFDAFTTNTLTFTATNTFVVVYVRSLSSIDGATEVFYDNFSLVEDVLSVDDFSTSNVKVSPNPANDFINIETNNINITSVYIYDILGKKVLSQKSLINNRLEISTLVSGVYFLQISANGKTVTKKIIKQ